MSILTPGYLEDGTNADGYSLVRADNHNVRIVGTSERMCVCYPIAPEARANGSWGWEYTGGDSKDYDETAEVQTDENGEDLFQDEDGNDVPASEVAVLDEEGEEVGRLGVKPAPAPKAAAGLLKALVTSGHNMAGLIEEAESVHIYDFDNGDEQDDDCAYKTGREEWEALAARVPEITALLEEAAELVERFGAEGDMAGAAHALSVAGRLRGLFADA